MFNLKLSLKFTPKTAIELNGIISHTHKHDFFKTRGLSSH